ncbi:GtrA family protein [Pontibacter silvestris]|uniref:GtrA family protein n=1 Tax=Pontibacter silvestris TaxID=2305183 RepID=A0ABW4WZC0_9BACT|nr:GtrA family protein [Pontibacter silvestris]MCC9136832.1 GtrA family protein [Pontibacter silvestris]
MAESIEVLILKFLKFGLVGVTGTVLDFGITYLAKEKLKWNKYLANSCGFIIAVSNNYYLNRIWTFNNTDPNIGWQFSKFMTVALIGLLLNNLIIYLLTERMKLNFYFAKLSATFIVFIWNFFLNYLFTFSR